MAAHKFDKHCLEDVLRRYARAVVHMRAQLKRGRFGLILGAGASDDLKFPKWHDLIQRIATHSKIAAPHLLRDDDSHARQAQLLWHHLKEANQFTGSTVPERELHDAKNKALWHTIIRECLYKDVPNTSSGLSKRDKYLWAFLPVIKGRGVTINYNFDDSIQTLISGSRSEEERQRSRGYRNVLNSELPISDREGVIYHPNGYLPHLKAERASENLIFQEKEFTDAAEDSLRGRYSSLSHYLAQTTRLLIGLSLRDPMLDVLLKRSARHYPGHCHYRIELLLNNRIADDHLESIRHSHWEQYNIITLFLKKSEIAALGYLLSMADEEFGMLADRLGVSAYRFYLTGAVAVGKSTAVSHFYSLRAHDEWLEMRIPGMERDPSLVDHATIAKIDQWVADQFHRKNHILSRADFGIDIVDRSPLDPFGFTEPTDWRKKAHLLRTTIAPDNSTARVSDGTVVLLLGDHNVMAARAIAKSKETTPRLLLRQQELLSRIFEARGPGVHVLSTATMKREEVAKEIAKTIYFDQTYRPLPMHQLLSDIESGEISYEPTLFDHHET